MASTTTTTQHLGHQESSRIVSEIEELFFSSQAEHLPVESIQFYLLNDLGYQDICEFEDALGGSFEDFLRTKMPNCVVKEIENPYYVEEGSETDNTNGNNTGNSSITQEKTRLVFSILPPEQKPPQKLKLRIKTKDDLWRIFLFAPAPCRVEIPQLEFEIQGSDKNQIDTIYQHIARAITNLEQHADMNKQSANAGALYEAIDDLRSLLDMDKGEFDWIVHDSEGKCEINPDEGVEIVKEDSTAPVKKKK